jgi:hypothetical protein
MLSQEYINANSFVDSVKGLYQAIIPLPYYHVGTDNFGTGLPDQSMLNSMVFAYHSNMPLMSSSSARTPIHEAKNLMQFFGPAFIEKKIQQDIKSKKPFLVLKSEGELSDQEKKLLLSCKKVYESDHFTFYELTYEFVFNSTAASSEFQLFAGQIPNLKKENGFLVSKVSDIIYYDFDSLHCDTSYHGKGSLKGEKRNYTHIINKQALSLNPEREYMISYWFYNDGEERNQINCIIAEQEPNNKDETWSYSFGPMPSMVIDGNWSLVEGKFKVLNKDSKLSIFFKGDDRSRQLIYVDDFMIRPADTEVFKLIASNNTSGDTVLFKNNLWIKKPRSY